jgi:hypothetical protein
MLQTYFQSMPMMQTKHMYIHKAPQKGWTLANYKIFIPMKWTVTRKSGDGTREEIEKTQNVDVETLTSQEWRDEFRTNFEKYESHDQHERATSYIRMYDSYVEDDDVVLCMMVKYYKDEIPFPEDSSEIALMHVKDPKDYIRLLKNENEQLHTRLAKKNHEIREKNQTLMRLGRRNNQLLIECREAHSYANVVHEIYNNSNAKYMDNYRNIIQQLYSELNKTFECPVCYDIIPNEKTFTTPCNHVLCNDCSKHCKNKCPMCRQEMCFTIDATE